MRDHSFALRTAMYQALNGQLTVAINEEGDRSDPIPVVDGKLESLPSDGVFVVFGDQVDNDKSNKNSFVMQTTFDVAIVDKRMATSSRQDVDDVCDQILQIVKPTISTTGLEIADPFRITSLTYLTGISTKAQTDQANQFIQVKRIQFLIRVTQ